MDALKWMDARSVAAIIKGEHPQIMALVLASLEGEQAAQVLTLLPPEIRTDVILRIARLDLIDPAALLELDQVLEKQLGKGQEFPRIGRRDEYGGRHTQSYELQRGGRTARVGKTRGPQSRRANPRADVCLREPARPG